MKAISNTHQFLGSVLQNTKGKEKKGEKRGRKRACLPCVESTGQEEMKATLSSLFLGLLLIMFERHVSYEGCMA